MVAAQYRLMVERALILIIDLWSAASVATGLVAGTYTVIVTDANSCTVTGHQM